MNKDLQSQLDYTVNVLKLYDPMKIILYGSMVRKKGVSARDIDLLIIKETEKSFTERIREVLSLLYQWDKKELWSNYLPIEPIVYTPEEFEERRDRGDFFIEEIANEGKVIYERE